ncbi:3-hydroxyacyl-CoA dehydrogenase family protein [Kutzneria sp. CA-103260]|uniref:3-hydroxyacyl-CoA dehydrogenase family protein n=1 Tax=Kutzneria sp. CA-103260 TaxID=2802641 RepID=UPI001BAD4819|nr:3-hydroxyacyl-CoA dehydrogenase family protein [Kutzneria sp. CA-103260]QUQ65744.1 3-hydroxybutyryl-CoA dehydrogenase [Kutzneria sp. CA-103260]
MNRPVGVIGAGTMGLGVAQSLAAAGHQVVVLEPVESVRSAAPDRLRDGLRLATLLKHFTGDLPQALSSVLWTSTPTDLSTVHFVIECAPERIALKQDLFHTLDPICPADTVFASCTSAIPITLLASGTSRPDLFLGMHFMNPAPLKPVVEVAVTPQTAPATLLRANELLASMGKRSLVVRDAPGFVSNRVLMSTINDAATVVQEGTASPATVDQLFEDCFGHRMGPLHTADLIGLDTIVDTLHVLLEITGDPRFTPCDLLTRMVRAGHLGKKTNQGFFN